MAQGRCLDNLPTLRAAAGHSITGLAKLANVSDWTIKTLENGGAVGRSASDRIVAALASDDTTAGMRSLDPNG